VLVITVEINHAEHLPWALNCTHWTTGIYT